MKMFETKVEQGQEKPILAENSTTTLRTTMSEDLPVRAIWLNFYGVAGLTPDKALPDEIEREVLKYEMVNLFDPEFYRLIEEFYQDSFIDFSFKDVTRIYR